MSGQLDIFAAPPRPAAPAVPPAPPSLASLLPARPIAWDKLLSRLGDPAPIILVSTRWTGVALEVARDDGARTRRVLYSDGQIGEIAYDSGAPARVVFLHLAQARALHALLPLLRLGDGGIAGVMLRAPLAGEAATPDPFDTLRVTEPCEA